MRSTDAASRKAVDADGRKNQEPKADDPEDDRAVHCVVSWGQRYRIWPKSRKPSSRTSERLNGDGRHSSVTGLSRGLRDGLGSRLRHREKQLVATGIFNDHRVKAPKVVLQSNASSLEVGAKPVISEHI